MLRLRKSMTNKLRPVAERRNANSRRNVDWPKSWIKASFRQPQIASRPLASCLHWWCLFINTQLLWECGVRDPWIRHWDRIWAESMHFVLCENEMTPWTAIYYVKEMSSWASSVTFAATRFAVKNWSCVGVNISCTNIARTNYKFGPRKTGMSLQAIEN